MADFQGRHEAQRWQQPPESGLEVVSSPNDYPEVYTPNDPNQLYVVPTGAEDQYKYAIPSANYDEYHPVHAAHDAAHGSAPEKAADGHAYPVNTPGTEPALPRRSRKKKIIALTVVAVLIIVGAVVGGVVGSQAARSQGSGGEALPSGDGKDNSGEEAEAAAASMTGGTGSPTSVSPGLAPTAVSWGYPHLEVFALTKNKTESVYRVWRNSNATSETEFQPGDQKMQMVGGSIDTAKAPSIGVSRRLFAGDDGRLRNRTEMHIYSVSGSGGYRKYHDDEELWSPYDGNNPGSPSVWDLFQGFNFLSAPAMLAYDRAVQRVKTFVMGAGSNGAAVHYFQWDTSVQWTGPIRIDGPGLHTWATPAVVAWAGDDTRLDLFAVSQANNHLLHTYKQAETDRWTTYEDLKGFVTTPPVAVSRAPGHIDVFARGGDGGLWHRALDATTSTTAKGNGSDWGAWRRLGGAAAQIRGQPAAVAVDGRVEVFAWGADGTGPLLHKTYDGTRWLPGDGGDADAFVTILNGGLSGPPHTATDGTGDVHVFAYSNRNELLWLKLGPDGKTNGDPVPIGLVPYMD